MPVDRKMNPPISRRAFLKISAAACGSVCVYQLLGNPRRVEIHETRNLMGTYVHFNLIGEDAESLRDAVERTYHAMVSHEMVFTLFDERSQLARLNTAGCLESPSPAMVEVLRQAQWLAHSSGGSFDISILPALKLMQDSFVREGRMPSSNQLDRVLDLVDYSRIRISDEEVTLGQGMELTLDGIAKGYIIDRGVEALKSMGYSNLLVEAGGDLVAVGHNQEERLWQIGIQSPRRSGVLTSIPASNTAIATSGDYMQYFASDYSQHHILDPRAGISPSELSSATVIAESCMNADALATALMVLGVDDGVNLIETLPGTEAYMVAKDQSIITTSGFPS